MDDRTRLRHMVDAAEEALMFVQGRSRADLNSDRMLTLSLVQEITIIGEAASQVSETTRERLSEIPWIDIIGMRNRLIHAYFDINLEILWSTIQEDLPSLALALQSELSQ